MIELKVRKFGDFLGIVLPKAVVRRLRTRGGASLFLVEEPAGSCRLVPNNPGFEQKMARAEDVIGRYRDALNKLAK
jgi:hypothetical protein